MRKLEVQVDGRGKKAGARPKSVRVKRLSTPSGDKATILSVDANSPTLAEDFLYVFTRNVRAARKRQKNG